MSSIQTTADPAVIGELAEKIYAAQYQANFERVHSGRFVAIDVTTQKAFLGDSPDEAFASARVANSAGVLYLIRVGHPTAFRVGV